jgi:hypothetical protein
MLIFAIRACSDTSSQYLSFFYWSFNLISCSLYWVLTWAAFCRIVAQCGVGGPDSLGISVVFFIMLPVVVFAALSYLSLARIRLLNKPMTAFKSPYEFERTHMCECHLQLVTANLDYTFARS